METKASTSTTAQKAGCGACVLGFVLPLAAAYSHIAAFPISFILGVGGWESIKAVVLTQYLDHRGTCRNSKLLLDRGAEEPFFLFNWLEEAPMPKTAELLAEYLSLPLKIDRRSENELDNAHDANDRGDRSRRE